jgi:hypothetical protein
MNITRQYSEDSELTQITVHLAAGDDPELYLEQLVEAGLLGHFLRAYARPGDLGAPDSAENAYRLLEAFAYITDKCNSRLEAMQLAARDQWRMGWGRIATAVHLARSTVKGRIQAARDRHAQQGIWYDADGINRGTPEAARSAGLPAWDRDGQEPYLDADDPECPSPPSRPVLEQGPKRGSRRATLPTSSCAHGPAGQNCVHGSGSSAAL